MFGKVQQTRNSELHEHAQAGEDADVNILPPSASVRASPVLSDPYLSGRRHCRVQIADGIRH